MNLRQFYRILLILLALALLAVTVLLTFAMAAHTGCTGQDCVPCLSLAKTQEVLRQSGGVFIAVAGVFSLLALLQLTGGELLRTQSACNLVRSKMRLNN